MAPRVTQIRRNRSNEQEKGHKSLFDYINERWVNPQEFRLRKIEKDIYLEEARTFRVERQCRDAQVEN
jgi:hypothetical protein